MFRAPPEPISGTPWGLSRHSRSATELPTSPFSPPCMNPAKRYEIFRRLHDADPEPKTELEHRSAFELLVAVILSAQATDKSVNIATRELFRDANTPAKILRSEEHTSELQSRLHL